MANEFKSIVDTQLPPVLASFLQRKGFDAIHTTSFPEGHLLEDEQINQIAIEQNRILVKKDNTFTNCYSETIIYKIIEA